MPLHKAPKILDKQLLFKHHMGSDKASMDSKLLAILMTKTPVMALKPNETDDSRKNAIYEHYLRQGGSQADEATIKTQIDEFFAEKSSYQAILNEKNWQIEQLARWMQRLDPNRQSAENTSNPDIIHQFSKKYVIDVYRKYTTPCPEHQNERQWVQDAQWEHGSRNYMEGVERAAYHYARESRQGIIELFTITDGILKYRNYAYEAGVMDTCFYLLAACPHFKYVQTDKTPVDEDYIGNRHLRAMQQILKTMDTIKEEEAENKPAILQNHLLLYALTLEKLETYSKSQDPLTFKEDPTEAIKLMLRMIQRHPQLLLDCLKDETNNDRQDAISHLKTSVRNYHQSRAAIRDKDGRLTIQKRWYEKIAQSYVNLHKKISSASGNLSLGQQEGMLGSALAALSFFLQFLLKALLFVLPSPTTAAQRGRLWSYGAYMYKQEQYLNSLLVLDKHPQTKEPNGGHTQTFLQSRIATP